MHRGSLIRRLAAKQKSITQSVYRNDLFNNNFQIPLTIYVNSFFFVFMCRSIVLVKRELLVLAVLP